MWITNNYDIFLVAIFIKFISDSQSVMDLTGCSII